MFQVDDDKAETVRGEEIETRRLGEGREGLRKEREEKSHSHGSVVRGLLLSPVTSWSRASDDGGVTSVLTRARAM